MNPRSSLLRRAAVPLLAVAAATALCGPTCAATASLTGRWNAPLYQVDDKTLRYAGTGYYYNGTFDFGPNPVPQGNYNLGVICSGPDYYNNTWYASTGG